jgi:hypothetical protein
VKKAAVAYFKVLFRHLPGVTEENYKNTKTSVRTARLRVEIVRVCNLELVMCIFSVTNPVITYDFGPPNST